MRKWWQSRHGWSKGQLRPLVKAIKGTSTSNSVTPAPQADHLHWVVCCGANWFPPITGSRLLTIYVLLAPCIFVFAVSPVNTELINTSKFLINLSVCATTHPPFPYPTTVTWWQVRVNFGLVLGYLFRPGSLDLGTRVLKFTTSRMGNYSERLSAINSVT